MVSFPRSLPIHRPRHVQHHRLRWFILIGAAVAAVAWRTQTAISTAPQRLKAAVMGSRDGRGATATLDRPTEQPETAPSPSADAVRARPTNVPPSNVVTTDETTRPSEPETVAAGEDKTGTFRPTRVATDEFGTVVTDTTPAGLEGAVNWVKGLDDGTCPDDYPIKGNASSRIYHLPGESSYAQTHPEYCFASEADAVAAGYRPRAK